MAKISDKLPARTVSIPACKIFQLPDHESNMEKMHRNRKRPQLWTPVLRTAAITYVAGFPSPPFDRLDIVLNLFLVIVTEIWYRDKGVEGAVGLLGHQFLLIIIEESI